MTQNLDTTYESVISRLSERGRLEWELALARETTAVLQQRLAEANAEIDRLTGGQTEANVPIDESA